MSDPVNDADAPLPAPADLSRALDARYAGLAAAAGSLSCGDALAAAAPRPGETVVDLGCGRGGDVLRAAALVGPAGLAIGVDGNEAMLHGILHAFFRYFGEAARD